MIQRKINDNSLAGVESVATTHENNNSSTNTTNGNSKKDVELASTNSQISMSDESGKNSNLNSDQSSANLTPIKQGSKFNLKRMVKKFPTTILTPGKEKNKEKGSGSGSNTVQRKSDTARFEQKLADISNPDERPFDDCDLLFHDCEEFLKLSNKTISFMKKTTGPNKQSKLNVASQINKWRAKRKENSLSQTFDALQSRLDFVHEQLNKYNSQAVKSTSALVVQALHLNVRLGSCIAFNKKEIEDLEPLLQSGQKYLNELKAAEVGLQCMLQFYEALETVKNNQPQPYIPWAQRMAAQHEKDKVTALEKQKRDADPHGISDVEIRLDREVINKRLRKLGKASKIVEAVMVTNMTQQRVRSLNLEHLERAQRAMLKLLERFRTSSISRATDSIIAVMRDNAEHVRQHQRAVDKERRASVLRAVTATSNGTTTTGIVSTTATTVTTGDATAGVVDKSGTISFSNPLMNPRNSRAVKATSAVAVDTSLYGESNAAVNDAVNGQHDTIQQQQEPVMVSSSSSLDCIDIYKIDSSKGSRRRSYTENHADSFSTTDTETSSELGKGFSTELIESKASPSDRRGSSSSSNSVHRYDSAADIVMPTPTRPEQLEVAEALEASVNKKEDDNEAEVIRVAFATLENTEFDVPKDVFDHSDCADCSCVFEMANECSMRLAATKMRARESTERSIKLQAFRDKMKADVDLLETHGWDGEMVA